MVAGRNRTLAGRQYAISGWPMLVQTWHAHAALCCGLGSRFQNGMACESNTAALCKSNGKDTIQTLSGTAWQGNGMVCVNWPLTLSLVMYIYGAPCKDRNFNVVYIYGLTFGNAESRLYFLHNVSTLNQCRKLSCVTVMCKHLASYQAYPNYRLDLIW
jgi:hypothetical protein